jgi:hypothetical protein
MRNLGIPSAPGKGVGDAKGDFDDDSSIDSVSYLCLNRRVVFIHLDTVQEVVTRR